uniref:Matrix AAA peptidase interacting protein 1 n=1 Tax=Sphenodon punctatus TaxID=8508 RepID=A0A8D0G9A9_SPHPU
MALFRTGCPCRWALRVSPALLFAAVPKPGPSARAELLLRLPTLGPLVAARPWPLARCYSTKEQRRSPVVLLLAFPRPFNWLRSQLYYFLIRTYWDKEFSAKEFTQGAKQAFALVSKLLSQCKLDMLEELVSEEVLQVLKEKLPSLSDNQRSALAVDVDEILYTTGEEFGIYYDDSGMYRTFTYISECTQGAKPDWTITRIMHPNLLK